MRKSLTIIGAGPGGLFLSLLYYKKYNITLIEQNSDVGGCWRVKEYPFFSEHSPKVIDGSIFKNLLEDIGLNAEEELTPTYDANLFKYFLGLFFNSFYIHELILFGITYIIYLLNLLPDIYVSEWTDFFKINHKGAELLNQISILLADNSKRFLLSDLFSSVKGNFQTEALQLTNHSKWLHSIKNKLKSEGVVILNAKAIYFNTNHCNIKHQEIQLNTIINHDILISTIPPNALSELLNNCECRIKYNWGEITPILDRSFYNSIGFQLHYEEPLPKDLFNKPIVSTKYNIICVVSSKYNTNLKPTISCTIVDQTLINSQSDIYIAINELVSEIKEITNTVPYHITKNSLKRSINGPQAFISEDTAYVRQKGDPLIPYKGEANNLFLVNSFNQKGITTLNKTLKNCLAFGKEFIN